MCTTILYGSRPIPVADQGVDYFETADSAACCINISIVVHSATLQPEAYAGRLSELSCALSPAPLHTAPAQITRASLAPVIIIIIIIIMMSIGVVMVLVVVGSGVLLGGRRSG